MKKIILWFPILLPAYLLRFSIGPLPTTTLETTLLLLALAVTWKQKSLWQDGWRATRQWHWPVALWIIATLIAVVVAPNHVASIGLWRAYILEPLVYALLLGAVLKTDEDRMQVISALVTVVVGICLWSIFQFITGLGIPHPWDTAISTRRATGPFPYPNAVALFCAPIVALCAGLLTSPFPSFVRRGVMIPLAGIVAGTIATLLAKSAGGMIAIIVCAIIAGIWQRKTRLWTVGVCALGLAAILLTPSVRTPLVKELTFQDWSGVVRLFIWRESFAMLKDHPIFGAGLGGYPEVFKPYHKATAIEIFQYPHNILFNFWSETGILGVLAFCWICWTWIRKTWAKQASPLQSRIIYLLPLIAILVHGLVDVPYFKNDLAMLFWILAVL